jgi:hypothetical protein
MNNNYELNNLPSTFKQFDNSLNNGYYASNETSCNYLLDNSFLL